MSSELTSKLEVISAGYATCSTCHDLDVEDDPQRLPYSELARAAYPPKVRVLFIAESAPGRNKRGRHSYFYLPENDPPTQDPSALFWAVAEILDLARSCGTGFELAKSNSAAWKLRLLSEFCSRGLWLLDSAKCAVNGLPEGRRRDAAVARCAKDWLRRELELISPEAIILLKTNVFRVVRPLLDEWGFGPRVLNERAIPHPGSGHQVEFRDLLGALVRARPSLFGV